MAMLGARLRTDQIVHDWDEDGAGGEGLQLEGLVGQWIRDSRNLEILRQ